LCQPSNSFAKNADYGIRGASAHWFKTYPTTTKQKVNISLQNQKEEFSSSWETTGSGAPLGTTLESLLFIMYIYYLPYGINSYAKPVIYSDDKTMLITANNLNDLQAKLNSTLNYVTTWILVIGLSLNIKKTNTIKFSSNHLQNDHIQITYQNKTMKEATNIKFLRSELDKYVNWKDHT
jgi:hypothetical protein